MSITTMSPTAISAEITQQFDSAPTLSNYRDFSNELRPYGDNASAIKLCSFMVPEASGWYTVVLWLSCCKISVRVDWRTPVTVSSHCACVNERFGGPPYSNVALAVYTFCGSTKYSGSTTRAVGVLSQPLQASITDGIAEACIETDE